MKTGISGLDFKLGVRMLVRHPGLTLIGGLGMAVAIAIGATAFETFYTLMSPTLPLDEGERVVAIESWDAGWNNQDRRILHDFAAWREEVRSVEELGAFARIRRNLIAPGGPAEPVDVAEMTASGFRVARVPPLLGRPLVPEDEREGAPPVVVIGHEVWRTRFQSDPGIVGREVRLGSTPHRVVGVMPEGFAFPVDHQFWTPLRADPSDHARRQGPEIFVFGRLAPGATLEGARAELATIGRRTAAAFPETHARMRPRVVPYTAQFFDDMSRWELHLMQLLVSMLLVVVGVNVAILVYARTATRLGEITVRSALGASRGRIVAQLFAEALVLAAGAAALGLAMAWLALRPLNAALAGETGGTPFWVDYSLSAGTVVYALGLAVLAAVIVGVVPALKATGRRLEASLRQLGGGTGMRLGRTWTVLIVVQVALAVAVLPAGIVMGWRAVRDATFHPGFAAEEFLTTWVGMDREPAPGADAEVREREHAARYGERQAELVRRLEAEPGVAAVTFASGVPGQEETALVEVDGVPAPAGSSAGHEVGILRVAPDFFEVFGVAVLAGRPFHSGDPGGAAAGVIVDRAFVQQVLGGGNALGRRMRSIARVDDDHVGAEAAGAAKPGPWYEIVGVVDDLRPRPAEPGRVAARMYHAAAPGQLYPVSLAVRVRGADPAAFAARLQEVTAALDPALRLQRVLPLDAVYREQQAAMRLGALAMAGVALSVLLLSAAGIYALMSFTVTRRRREIGIRSALGADPRRILGSVFSRALGQLSAGLVLGVLAAVPLATSIQEDAAASLPWVLPVVAALMTVVGVLAALGPARRGLRIQPSEALKEEA